mmetsp:Transcript_20397/g.65200  ORF Transcript_20397/g.65200 Transcript_20397/m.65200 type:complete len:282 (+) Transcript_20397:103-948(+)
MALETLEGAAAAAAASAAAATDSPALPAKRASRLSRCCALIQPLIAVGSDRTVGRPTTRKLQTERSLSRDHDEQPRSARHKPSHSLAPRISRKSTTSPNTLTESLYLASSSADGSRGCCADHNPSPSGSGTMPSPSPSPSSPWSNSEADESSSMNSSDSPSPPPPPPAFHRRVWLASRLRSFASVQLTAPETAFTLVLEVNPAPLSQHARSLMTYVKARHCGCVSQADRQSDDDAMLYCASMSAPRKSISFMSFFGAGLTSCMTHTSVPSHRTDNATMPRK